MKPDEAAFESHIAEWLVDHGGYTAWKLGTQSTDFDPARGFDTVELSTATADSSTSTTQASESSTGQDASGVSGFVAEVWADDWFALYVNGELVGEDSVPMTTERSFNAETITFEAEYPLTIAIEAKDFKETDSGIEYIGEPKQQMGDGGLIAQITDTETGEVIAVSTSDWSTLVIHQAPLNVDCVSSVDPDADCEFYSVDAPDDWTSVGFDDSSWVPATEWSVADVSSRDGTTRSRGIPRLNWCGVRISRWTTRSFCGSHWKDDVDRGDRDHSNRPRRTRPVRHGSRVLQCRGHFTID